MGYCGGIPARWKLRIALVDRLEIPDQPIIAEGREDLDGFAGELEAKGLVVIIHGSAGGGAVHPEKREKDPGKQQNSK